MKTYKIKPIYKSFVWAGNQINEKYGIDKALGKIGTIYNVIAIEGDLDNVVEETGEKLSTFYKYNPKLFGINEDIFPVRMTITCNDSYQSYQLHPNDEYALKHEGTKGKVSGAVTLFPDENDSKSRITRFGNKCKSLDEFKQLLEKEDWENLFDVIEKPEGYYLHTPAGVIHGGKGSGKIAATWGSNGDITYRFFDYHRDDPKRPLHLKQIYETINIPEVELPRPVNPTPIMIGENAKLLEYYDKAGEYTAKRIQMEGSAEYEYPGFVFYACAEGQGSIAGREIKIGETIFVPCNFGKIKLEGKMDLLLLSYHKD